MSGVRAPDAIATVPEANDVAPRKLRGFAAIKSRSPETLAAISQLGGIAAHARGAAHEWDSGEASDAGRKGGRAAAANKAARKAAK